MMGWFGAKKRKGLEKYHKGGIVGNVPSTVGNLSGMMHTVDAMDVDLKQAQRLGDDIRSLSDSQKELENRIVRDKRQLAVVKRTKAALQLAHDALKPPKPAAVNLKISVQDDASEALDKLEKSLSETLDANMDAKAEH